MCQPYSCPAGDAMSKVYFKKINSNMNDSDRSEIAKELLAKIIAEEKIKLEKTVPLKVHFGEEGNITYVKPENYTGIIDFLKNNNIKSQFMETSTLYGGQRYKRELHAVLAKKHGFTKLPVVFADGDRGEEFSEVSINKKHFKTCKIGRKFLDHKQIIVLSHFKGHMLAGFGGAIKQLAMGHAAKGGKLAMHMGVKPRIKNNKCVRCGSCLKVCNQDAIIIQDKEKGKSYIDHSKCVGCGACFATCPHKAITIFSLKSLSHMFLGRNEFREKLVEYAYAAQLGKRNIYVNFVMNITKGCDCEGREMKPLMDDIGICVSTDPVAIDRACYDMVKKKGKAFKGVGQLSYAEKIGLGSQEYEIIQI